METTKVVLLSFLALIFLISGLSKASGNEKGLSGTRDVNVPDWLARVTGVFEAAAALGLVLALKWSAFAYPALISLWCIMAGAIFACLTSSRFTAILALGVVGVGIAMLYFMFSAPDLAMTQVLVETLTLVLFVLAFYRLPVFGNYSKRSTKIRDALLAAVFGTVMAMVVLVEQSSRAADNAVSRFMGENSLTLANGRNVVNVILVDFRALDTLGEITVLAIAALGVFAMLRLRPGRGGKEDR
jgi:multicomponent Na+:H+ antiporter subunit A